VEGAFRPSLARRRFVRPVRFTDSRHRAPLPHPLRRLADSTAESPAPETGRAGDAVTSDDYQAQADDCEVRARTAPTADLREAYARLADQWRALAEDTRRRESGAKL